MHFHLQRSPRRKNIALQVKNGEIFVRAPSYVSNSYIEQVLHNKKCWLEKKIGQQIACKSKSNQIFDGGQLWLLGQMFRLSFVFDSNNSFTVQFEEQVAQVTLRKNWLEKSKDAQQKKAKTIIEQWLKQQITDLIDKKVMLFSSQMALNPTGIKVRQYKSRWGSCTNKGVLYFNYLLYMVPEPVINYVVIHELAHLKYFNHSNQFWHLVAKYCPKFEEHKLWLKQNQYCLQW